MLESCRGCWSDWGTHSYWRNLRSCRGLRSGGPVAILILTQHEVDEAITLDCMLRDHALGASKLRLHNPHGSAAAKLCSIVRREIHQHGRL